VVAETLEIVVTTTITEVVTETATVPAAMAVVTQVGMAEDTEAAAAAAMVEGMEAVRPRLAGMATTHLLPPRRPGLQ